ncbi:MAG: S8/S53 family peptidase [Chitinophagaceae bacterium]|nr:S8/S53 family peptidase [Chitinophagaceae bacterium]
MDVKVENFETVRLLRASGLIRYAEPMGYEPRGDYEAASVLSSSGCGNNVAEPSLVAGSDYTTISPNTKQSWNYTYHNIPSAWAKTTGKGIKVFIIDTGTELDQENLGSAFNQGSSSGRTVEKIVTLPRSTFLGIPTGPVETPDDGCGHGTSMAGACAAPRGIDGAACGVAYNCNLVTCRGAEDVYLDASREVKGVSDAYTNAANRADVKIISMSMGKITSSSQLSDAIKYAYGKGKLMFCAAGTSFGWTAGWFGVIFPGYMAEVNAVTGVRDNNLNTNCTDCHKGSETDFTVVMEKASSERHPITLAMTGDAPSTVGGSSVSTATTSGMAALIWSRFPAYTRDQVLNKMIQSSSNYPNRNSNLGWGNVNADAATN